MELEADFLGLILLSNVRLSIHFNYSLSLLRRETRDYSNK